jgi:hypothetical protein
MGSSKAKAIMGLMFSIFHDENRVEDGLPPASRLETKLKA